MVTPGQMGLSAWQHTLFSGEAARRLLAACACGGMVGAQRELRHKSSGLRTNMLMAMGAALFTMMSAVLAGELTTDKTRIASNVVQGVGFLGAGLILHNKSRVQGLTTAASVFVVAAIGMACGGGAYAEAVIATLLVLIALWGVGALESKAGWQRYPLMYEVRAEGSASAEPEAAQRRMIGAILHVLDGAGLRLEVEERESLAGLQRVCFSVLANRRTHARLLHELRESDATDKVLVFRDVEDE